MDTPTFKTLTKKGFWHLCNKLANGRFPISLPGGRELWLGTHENVTSNPEKCYTVDVYSADEEREVRLLAGNLESAVRTAEAFGVNFDFLD